VGQSVWRRTYRRDDPCISPFAWVWDEDVAVSNVLAAVGLAGWVAYKTVQDGSARGQTLGKRALGIRVVDLRTGGPIGRPRAAVRALLLVALLFLCLIFLIVELFRRDPQQLLHDRAVGSIIVKT
jgi:uncharacterized RDD family membrane protein YckC